MKSQVSQIASKQKVFVGMSGGVDSSVSAALLKDAGYDITGVFIKVWQPDWIECTWKDERREAMRVAAHLDIPFVTLDLVHEYKIEVIDYMIAEYRAGRTPNPDVMCNREVKFGAFWRWAQKQGADFVATGHYAQVIREGTDSADEGNFASRVGDENSARPAGRDARPETAESVPSLKLLAGTDINKDQSYFLWTLNQADLKHILFPVGHLTKPEVRVLAKKFKLPNAEKKDSQGLCFIGKVDIKDFLSRYIDTKPGDVLNEQGEIIGTHSGSLLLTIGERHGFTITKKTPHDAPYYVVSKDAKKNTVTVTNRIRNEERVSQKGKQHITLQDVNWVGSIPGQGTKLQARTRYRQELQNINIVKVDADSATVEFKRYQETIAPGQSLVIYHGDACIGGGIIL